METINGRLFVRCSADKPDWKTVNTSKKNLHEILFEQDNSDLEQLQELANFQDEDGSFKLLDSWKVPSDVRVEECYVPTYLGAAIFMRDYLLEQNAVFNDSKSCLKRALKISLGRGFEGHGYDSESGLIEALKIFSRGGLRDFLRGPIICWEFNNLIIKIFTERSKKIRRDVGIKGVWGEDYTNTWIKLLNELVNPYMEIPPID